VSVRERRVWSWGRPRRRPDEAPPVAVELAGPAPGNGADEWNLWELERRARAHAGAHSLPEEWAAIFRHLREFARSDGRLPPQFDILVRETFPELTHG
jgi:hypothetical protein